MRKLALITSVLVGLAPIVEAQPWRGDTYDHHDYDRHTDEAARANGRFVPLVAMDIRRKETVDIGGREAGTFRGIRLQALRGAAYVDFVTVRFGNGEQQHVDIRRRIGRDEIVDVPFTQERYIAAVTVHGQPDQWSRIQILGMR